MTTRDYCLLGIRPKRPNRSLNVTWEKFIIPLPLSLKCQIMRLAREANLSQAAFGLVIVRAALANEAWLAAAIRSAANQETNSSGQRNLVMEDRPQPKPTWSTGKKLCRFHLDKELYFELQRVAAMRRITMTAYIEQALRECVSLEDVNGAGVKAAA